MLTFVEGVIIIILALTDDMREQRMQTPNLVANECWSTLLNHVGL